jgi:hypothetical protein
MHRTLIKSQSLATEDTEKKQSGTQRKNRAEHRGKTERNTEEILKQKASKSLATEDTEKH